MVHDQRELAGIDPHALLFGHDDALEDAPPVGSGGPRSGHRHRHQRTRRRHGRVLVVMTLVALLIVAAAGWFVVRPIVTDRLAPKDYAGPGTGEVLVRVNTGDTAGAIGRSLEAAGVVRTVSAFTHAAAADSDSQNIQPGVYRLHREMAAGAALNLMLDPSSRIIIKVTVPEGTTEADVLSRLATALHTPIVAIRQAAADVPSLGLPEGYQRPAGSTPAGSSVSASPMSAEGFLYPDTYSFDPGTTPTDALQQMIAVFTGKDRELKFAASAKAVRMSAYQALIVASMIEGEAKFDADRAKVARVVYNRMAAGLPVGIDATSKYGEQLAGRDPARVDYNRPAPYNTRLTPGLPPTPIGNPGEAAMAAAVTPAAGNWLYYVNGDADGHLFFTNDPKLFSAAVVECQVHKWGCT